MKVNDRHVSFYYENDDDYGPIEIEPRKTALLVIDIYGVIQAVYNLRQRARDGFAAVCCAVSAAAGGAGEKQCEREQERRKLFGFSHGKFPFRF